MRLKTDVLSSTNDGLMSEKKHLTTELNETRSLYKTYEEKCSELMNSLHEQTTVYQELKRNMIGHNEEIRQKNEKIDHLLVDLDNTKKHFSEMEINHGSLRIQFDKIKEQLDLNEKELKDVVEKLHITNKVRHETEVKLGEYH